MVEASEMNRPKWLTEEEFWAVMMGRDKDSGKKMMSFRLTPEAQRIITHAGDDIGDKTKALELIVRFYREHEQRRKK